MDWGEILEAAENNPEVKSILSKMTGKAEGEASQVADQAASKATPVTETASVEPTENAPQQSVTPNVHADAPADQSQWGSGEGGDGGEGNEPPPESTGGMSPRAKMAIGAGAAGLGAAGIYAARKDDEPPSSDDGMIQPTESEAPKNLAADEKAASDEDQTEEADKSKTASPAKNPRDVLNDPKASRVDKLQAMQAMLNFGSADQNKSGLAAAQAKQNDYIARQTQLRGLAQIAAGIARVTPNLSVYDENIKRSGLPVEQYLQKQKNEAEDPTSGISSGMRDYMKRLGVQVSDGATASQISSVLPYVFKDIESKQQQEAKSEDVKYRADALKQQRLIANQQHQDQQAWLHANKEQAQDLAEGKDITSQINALKASSRSPLGQASLISQKSQRLQELVNNPNTTPQDMSAAAADLNSMISQTTTMTGTQHQEYNNLATEWTKALNYLSSGADPVEVPKVKAHLADVAQRMGDLSDRVMAANTQAVKAMHPNYEARHPGRIDEAAGLFAGAGKTPGAKLPHQGQFPPGSTVKIKDKTYKVGADGDSLTEQ